MSSGCHSQKVSYVFIDVSFVVLKTSTLANRQATTRRRWYAGLCTKAKRFFLVCGDHCDDRMKFGHTCVLDTHNRYGLDTPFSAIIFCDQHFTA